MFKIVNLRSAKYLVRRYKKFLKIEIPENMSFYHILVDQTGFCESCILCKEVLKNNDNILNCFSCIWALSEDDSKTYYECANDNYRAMFTATHEEGKKLLTERIAMLKELIKKAESKK